MNQKVVGFIGFGEAGFHIARGLRNSGVERIVAFDKFWNQEPYAGLIQRRAAEVGVKLLPTLAEMLTEADFVFSAASAKVAAAIAAEAAPYLTERHTYVDINAAAPTTKVATAQAVGVRAKFVDVAVMGPVPMYGHKVPILASGPGAQVFAVTFVPFGMDITVLGDRAGQASAIKMFRSVFMKGYVVLLLETLFASHEYGVEHMVLDSLAETFNKGDFMTVANGLVTRGVIHAERRAHEMEEVLQTLQELNVESTMSQATKEKLLWVAGLGLKERFKGEPPKSFEEILAAIDQR